MRSGWIVAASVALAAALSAQSPPANAKDITDMPAQAQPPPSAVIAAPPSVVRIFVENITGADANALAGLITQNLFDSKQVVVTTNQSNASLVLRGNVARQPIPGDTASAKHTVRRSRSHASASAGAPTSPFGDNAPVTELPPLGSTTAPDNGMPMTPAAEGGDLALSLPMLGAMDSPTDLTKYRYRLNLELINPNGDLVWMSGQGKQALPFQDADDAVSRTLAPLLALVKQMAEPAAGTNAANGGGAIPH